MSQGEVGVAPKLNMSLVDKHRPSTLELSGDRNKDYALRIVSPGLPALNEEMKSTIKLSQKIEQQQKNLIAARHSGSGSGSVTDAGEAGANRGPESGGETIVVSENKNMLPDEMDKLATPTTVKRLQRENIPAPLSMGSGHTAGTNPTIQSAPIKQNPWTARMYPRRCAPYLIQVKHQQPSPYMQPMQRRYRYVLPQFNVAHTPPRAQPGYKRMRMAPYTAAGRYFPMRPQGTAMMSAIPKSSLKSLAVTDVYHGDYTKTAPLHSQPLSAQHEVFDSSARATDNSVEDDRIPVSEDEIKEMQEKYDNDVESTAIDDDDDLHISSPGDEVFGSINFMNETTFNFKMFSQNQSAQEPAPSAEEHLAKEKEKFLKICETSWDEFMNSRM